MTKWTTTNSKRDCITTAFIILTRSFTYSDANVRSTSLYREIFLTGNGGERIWTLVYTRTFYIKKASSVPQRKRKRKKRLEKTNVNISITKKSLSPLGVRLPEQRNKTRSKHMIYHPHLYIHICIHTCMHSTLSSHSRMFHHISQCSRDAVNYSHMITLPSHSCHCRNKNTDMFPSAFAPSLSVAFYDFIPLLNV